MKYARASHFFAAGSGELAPWGGRRVTVGQTRDGEVWLDVEPLADGTAAPVRLGRVARAVLAARLADAAPGPAPELAGIIAEQLQEAWLAGLEAPAITSTQAYPGMAEALAEIAAAQARAVTLTAEQAAVVRRALADAEEYRRERVARWCDDCETHPAGACDTHTDELDQAVAYHQVANDLGQEVPDGA